MFTDGKRKRPSAQPPSLPDISRASIIKVLGVTISNKLSVSDHITSIISKCSQTLYALTILRAHGLCDVALQSVYRSMVIARLLYASSAWWGFTSSSDRQRIAAFVRRVVRRGFCPDLLTIDKLVPDMDNKLFNCITSDEQCTSDMFSPARTLLPVLVNVPSV